MSIKLMSQVWEKDFGHSEQSVLLAMADYADDEGRNCYPSYERLAWKTGYSKRQVGRIIAHLCARNIIVILKASCQHQANHYWIRLDNAKNKQPFSVDILGASSSVDIVSTPQDVSVDTMSTLTISSIDKLSMLSDSSVDISDIASSIDKLSTLDNSSIDNLSTVKIQHRQIEHPGWTNETSSIDMVSTDPLVNHHKEPEREKEKTHVREPLAVAWRQAYGETEMPPQLVTSLEELVGSCGMAAAIHGIKASAVKENGRNFRYIAECARNYVPPAPKASYANTNGYHVDIPGVYALPAVEKTSPAPLPPPLAHDDPWAVVLSDIAPTLTRQSLEWLKDSRCEASGELAGVPLYRVIVNGAANVGWLKQQAEPLIRKTLSSLLRKRLLIEIITEQEPSHA